jgi:prepilin-type N-terminal cleavage/methylation domain-containing protein
MLKRRGFTLLELLVSIVLLGIIGLAMARLMTSMLRVTTAQVQVAGAQGTSRSGVLAIPSEFREIGYDTLPGVGNDGDLISIAANRITFRAMRGMGNTCAVTFVGGNTLTELRIRKPIFGMRSPVAQDSFRLFVENDKSLGGDDQWVSLDVTNIDNTSNCGADEAIRLTIGSAPVHTGSISSNILGTEVWVGGPVRWFERMEYAPFIDGTTGRTYIGARRLNLNNTLDPMIGPLPDSTGFALTYYDADNVVLDPTNAANRIKVRSIGINLTGTGTAPVSLYGASSRARGNVPVFTRVALRNNLRPAP